MGKLLTTVGISLFYSSALANAFAAETPVQPQSIHERYNCSGSANDGRAAEAKVEITSSTPHEHNENGEKKFYQTVFVSVSVTLGGREAGAYGQEQLRSWLTDQVQLETLDGCTPREEEYQTALDCSDEYDATLRFDKASNLFSMTHLKRVRGSSTTYFTSRMDCAKTAI